MKTTENVDFSWVTEKPKKSDVINGLLKGTVWQTNAQVQHDMPWPLGRRTESKFSRCHNLSTEQLLIVSSLLYRKGVPQFPNEPYLTYNSILFGAHVEKQIRPRQRSDDLSERNYHFDHDESTRKLNGLVTAIDSPFQSCGELMPTYPALQKLEPPKSRGNPTY